MTEIKGRPLAWRAIDPGRRFIATGLGFTAEVAMMHSGLWALVCAYAPNSDHLTEEVAKLRAQDIYDALIRGAAEVERSGTEILSRDVAGPSPVPASLAYLAGGQGAAEAPTHTEAEVKAMLAATVMEAAKSFEGDSNLSRQLCCNGQDCGCQGAAVEDYVVHMLNALIRPDAKAALEAYRDREVAKALEGIFTGPMKMPLNAFERLTVADSIGAPFDAGDVRELMDAICAMIPEVQP